MAKQVLLNRTDSPVSGVTSLTLPMAVLNYGKDFRVKSNEPTEAVITNLTSPVGRPERYRFGCTEVKDVYRNSGIEASLIAPSRRGSSILCQLTDTWSVIDSTNTAYEVALPIEGHIVLKIPANELITETQVKDFIGRLCAGLFETGDGGTTRLSSLLRGSLLPKEL